MQFSQRRPCGADLLRMGDIEHRPVDDMLQGHRHAIQLDLHCAMAQCTGAETGRPSPSSHCVRRATRDKRGNSFDAADHLAMSAPEVVVSQASALWSLITTRSQDSMITSQYVASVTRSQPSTASASANPNRCANVCSGSQDSHSISSRGPRWRSMAPSQHRPRDFSASPIMYIMSSCSGCSSTG